MPCEKLLQLLDNAPWEDGKQGGISNDIAAHVSSCQHCSCYNPNRLLDDVVKEHAPSKALRRVSHHKWLLYWRQGTLLLALILLVSVSIISGVSLIYAANSTTVTITPDHPLISDGFSVTGVIGQPDPAQMQISAPRRSVSNPSQATVQGTGHNHIPAKNAKGTLIFFNTLLTSQTVAAGTPISVGKGVEIITDRLLIIPPATKRTLGTASVSAHASSAGIVGNIRALTLNRTPCCGAGITVSNTAAFTGGQDQQHYTFVQQSDVDAVANPLGDQLKQQSRDQLKAKRAQGEMPIGQPQCDDPNVSEDQLIGDHGRNIPSTTSTVSVTCREHLYNQQQLQKLAEGHLQEKTTSQYGPNYKLVGAVQVKPMSQTVNDESVNMVVDAKGVWVFQPTDAQEAEWKRWIAGQSKLKATTFLQSQKGVSKASIQMSGDTVSDDTNKIGCDMENVEGLSPIANP